MDLNGNDTQFVRNILMLKKINTFQRWKNGVPLQLIALMVLFCKVFDVGPTNVTTFFYVLRR